MTYAKNSLIKNRRGWHIIAMHSMYSVVCDDNLMHLKYVAEYLV